ncbi:CAAX protease self-immunity [Agromyces sp. CF514]|uniref:CPBP family intramembrane glutamic endopeptidase n=1 Tax=Agromyces sp. CF514 TaxID=1881031 RepID=UPI0008EF3564|nr:CPBP family intramembrane glutamic endopeptidase [Agromyces sp. CF514]SFR70830.1 CAAX protease self-immunity [Agromyces sp. CF514]
MTRGTARAALIAYFIVLIPLVALLSTLVIANPEQTAYVYAVMFAPAASALLAWPISGVRPRFGRFGWRSLVLPVGLIAIVGLGYLLGGLAGILQGTGDASPDPVSLAIGIPTSIALALGEELGWRGYLLPQLRRVTGFWAANAVVAGVWFLFHLPIILWAAYAPTDRPLVVALLWFAVNLALFSFTIGALWELTHDVWMPAIAHGLWNVVVADLLPGAFDDSPSWLLGEFGFVPVLPLVVALLLALLLSRGRRPARLDLRAGSSAEG